MPRIAFKANGSILLLDLADIVAVWRRSSNPTVLFASTARSS
jgi:hypothetical protein